VASSWILFFNMWFLCTGVYSILKYCPSVSVVKFGSPVQFCDGIIFSLIQMQPHIPLRVSRSVQRNYVIVNDLTHCYTKLHPKEIRHSTCCHCEGNLPKDSAPKLPKGNLKCSYEKSSIPIQPLKMPTKLHTTYIYF